MKWMFVPAALAIAVIAIGLVTWISNRGVAAELEADPRGERAQKVMMIHFPSGKRIPVNYLREGDRVYAGADGPWWRELRGQGVFVELLIRGERLRGIARAVEDDPELESDVFSRLRPTVPKWLPSWIDAVLVEIRLTPEPASGSARAAG